MLKFYISKIVFKSVKNLTHYKKYFLDDNGEARLTNGGPWILEAFGDARLTKDRPWVLRAFSDARITCWTSDLKNFKKGGGG